MQYRKALWVKVAPALPSITSQCREQPPSCGPTVATPKLRRQTPANSDAHALHSFLCQSRESQPSCGPTSQRQCCAGKHLQVELTNYKSPSFVGEVLSIALPNVTLPNSPMLQASKTTAQTTIANAIAGRRCKQHAHESHRRTCRRYEQQVI